jgi:hypothetical protein
MNHPGSVEISLKPSLRVQALVTTAVEADADAEPTLLVALAVLL